MKTGTRTQDEKFMARCLELARKGRGHVSPNPMVGAVLVKDGKLVAEAYHRRFGGAHAEVEAINAAREEAASSTLYVNLEPCVSYRGKKTPPCTDSIISHRIRRVVIGMLDPNPLVRGKGARVLRSAGITVEVGVLRNECNRLNEVFVKKMTTGLPFVALKIAETLDGKITLPGKRLRWITSLESRRHVHRLRSEYDAVLVGARTVAVDNPRLTVRHVRGRQPMRIVLDGNLSSPVSSHLFSDSQRSRTIVYCSESQGGDGERKKSALKKRQVQVIELPSNDSGILELRRVLKHLASLGISSVLVEGGQFVFSEFVRNRLVDKMYLFIAPKFLGSSGLPAFGELGSNPGYWKCTISDVEVLGTDLLIEAYVGRSR